MKQDWERRDFLSLMGIGGVVFASGLVGCGGAASSGATPTMGASTARKRLAGEDFFFLQLSDTHWGFKGPPNPQADVTLEHAVATINAVDVQPDFIVFTGDLTHATDDAAERRTRMARFKEIVSALKVKDVRFIPGEHDASLDRGDAYREAFGDTSAAACDVVAAPADDAAPAAEPAAAEALAVALADIVSDVRSTSCQPVLV